MNAFAPGRGTIAGSTFRCSATISARTARRRDHDQRFHCSLSLRDLMLGFREFGDVIAGVLQCDELATARQRDRFIEPSLPTAISHWRVAAADVSMKCLFGLDREADQYFE